MISRCRGSNPAAPTGQSVSNAYGIGSRSKVYGLQDLLLSAYPGWLRPPRTSRRAGIGFTRSTTATGSAFDNFGFG